MHRLGAAVTKVEPPDGDLLALCAPDWYAALTEGQQVLTLDIKGPDRAEFDDLIGDADLLITSMRPSALKRLGLSRPHEIYPELSLIEIVGHDGLDAERPGHDLNYQAPHGTLTPPAMPTVPIADMLGANAPCQRALTALFVRSNSGAGQIHRVVLEEAAGWAGDSVRYGLTAPGAVLGGALPGYGIYAASDARRARRNPGQVKDYLGRYARPLEPFCPHFAHPMKTRAKTDGNRTFEPLLSLLSGLN